MSCVIKQDHEKDIVRITVVATEDFLLRTDAKLGVQFKRSNYFSREQRIRCYISLGDEMHERGFYSVSSDSDLNYVLF